MDHIEYCQVHWPVELDSGYPFLDPADSALQGLDPGERYPDGVACAHPDRQLDAAALGRKIEQIDAPAMFAGAAEVDIRAKRDPFRPAPMVLHGRLPEIPS